MGFFRPFHRVFEIADLGVSRGETPDRWGVFVTGKTRITGSEIATLVNEGYRGLGKTGGDLRLLLDNYTAIVHAYSKRTGEIRSVIDSTPVLPYADARALAPLVDGIIFVGRSGLTTRDALQRSLELLAEVHSAPVLEIVLNDVGLPAYRSPYGYSQPTTLTDPTCDS